MHESKPEATIKVLAEAQAAGVAVIDTLRHKADLTMLSSGKHSLASMRSGVRSWCAFSTLVLGTDPRCTVPPASVDQVLCWLSVFQVSGTALNYAGHLHKFCCFKTVWSAWYQSPQMDLWRRWSLLRVPSEAIPLQAGAPNELTVQSLPGGRHSSVVVLEDKVEVVLARRKHRPRGSVMTRGCMCRIDVVTMKPIREAPRSWSQICPLCCTRKFLQQWALQLGQRLIPVSSGDFMRAVRTAAGAKGVSQVALLRSKTFRTGMATQLALLNMPLATLLQGGEWRSRAYLAYVSADSVDAQCFVKTMCEQELDGSDEED